MTVRLALISYQRAHIFEIVNYLKAAGDVELVALAEEDAALRDELARTYGIPAYVDYREMLEAVKPDAALVAPINSEKAGVIVHCIRAGVHVIVDKPLCTEFGQADQIERALEARPVRLAMHAAGGNGGHAQALRHVIRESLGDIISFTSTSTHRWHVDPASGLRPDWSDSRHKYGGAIVVDGINGVNTARWLTGKRAVGVTAMHTNVAMPEHPEFEDTFVIVAKLEGGALATIAFQWHTPDGEPTHGRGSTTIVGTRGILEIRSAAARHASPEEAARLEAAGIFRSSENETILTTMTEAAHSITLPEMSAPSVEADFLAGIRDPHHQPITSPASILEATRLTLAARQSADEHRSIRLR